MVTGANGFLGSNLITSLLEKDEVSILGVYHNKKDRLQRFENKRIKCFQCDLSNRQFVQKMFKLHPVDAVIHAAASINEKDNAEYIFDAINSNILSQSNLVTEAQSIGCSRFIYCSSISVYGHSIKGEEIKEEDKPCPKNIYGWSKNSAEDFLRVALQLNNKLMGVSLRFAGIHGAGRLSGVIYQMVKSALSGDEISVIEPESQFRILFVEDAVQAILLSLICNLKERYQCYNVAGRDIVNLAELASKITSAIESKGRIKKYVTSRVRYEVQSISKIQNDLGYTPKSLSEHLNIYINQMKKQKTEL